MKVLILSRISLRHLPYWEILSEIPVQDRFLIIDAAVLSEASLKDVSQHFCEIIRVENYGLSGMVEKSAARLHRKWGIERIVAISEFDLIRAGKLRNYFKISGQSFESALAFRDKIKMKQAISKAGLRTPKYRIVDTAIDVLNFVEQHQLPVVIKPFLGSGSENTFIVRNEVELDEALRSNMSSGTQQPASFEIEEFIEGDMYHIDGVWIDGEMRLCGAGKYVHPCTQFASGKPICSHFLEKTNPLLKRLCDTAEKILRALPTPEDTCFHIEVFLTPDDQLVFCEAASRVGGPFIFESFRISYGFAIAPQFIRQQAGLPVKIEDFMRNGPSVIGAFIIFPRQKGKLIKAPESCPFEWAENYFVTGEYGTSYEKPVDVLDFIASVLLRGNSDAEVESRMETAIEWFETNTIWES